MNNLLTAKDVQQLLQVDRSTVYRMAEDGRLPAVKVGKQWRFSADQLQEKLGPQLIADVVPAAPVRHVADVPASQDETSQLAAVLPLECVQLIQDSHADLLGVMLVVTDLDGIPVTRPSNPCGMFAAVSENPSAIQKCISSWHDLGQTLNIEPVFHKSHLGLLCARGLIRVGNELQGMVIAGCVAPSDWPPVANEIWQIANEFGVEPDILAVELDHVYMLNEQERAAVLSSVQRVANIVAHIVQERRMLLGRLDKIADMARLDV